jgi:hypothetical protein
LRGWHKEGKIGGWKNVGKVLRVEKASNYFEKVKNWITSLLEVLSGPKPFW